MSTEHPKHTTICTTRNGGTIRGSLTPTGAVDHVAGVYYTPPTNPNKEPF